MQLRIKGLTAFFLFLFAFQTVARADEGPKITLSFTRAPLKKVLKAIEKQCDFIFFYNDEQLAHAAPVNIRVKDMPLEKVLEIIFEGQQLDYIFDENWIVLKTKTGKVNGPDSISRAVVSGQVKLLDSIPVALENVNVINRNTGYGTYTDTAGLFKLPAKKGDILELSYAGLKKVRLTIHSTEERYVVGMDRNIREQDPVMVYNTGFTQIFSKHATGSYVQVDQHLLNRSTSTTVIDRLQDVTSSMLFLKGNSNPLDNMIIRGESTISANKRPLIIVDNFEYEGDISNINPNDIDNITILRDADAAAVWGALAANGVIVMTTKSGKYSTKTQITVNSNITITNKPDLFFQPTMSVSDFIDIERSLFEKGFYDDPINSSQRPPLTPVVGLLLRNREGEITDQEMEAQIFAWRKYDVRRDISKLLYRRSVNQQHAISLSGGSTNNKYYASVGYDKNASSVRGDDLTRLTMNFKNTYSLINSKLELTTGILFAQINTKSNGLSEGEIPGLYPYARLVDDEGNSLMIPQYRQGFIDTAGGTKLLRWDYRPVDEISLTNNSVKTTDYRVSLKAHYRIIPGLSIDLNYQYGKGVTEGARLFGMGTYFTRDYINQFTSIDWSTGTVYRPVPLGSILHQNNISYASHNARVQLNFYRSWKEGQSLTITSGAALQDQHSNEKSDTYYGYSKENPFTLPMDYAGTYIHYVTGNPIRISNGESFRNLTNRFVYYFGNASYTFKDRYTVTASARKDASNLFGVSTNQKWVPLWAAGVGWELSKEKFFSVDWMPYLRLRATYGYSGNVDRTVTAFLVARINGTNAYNSPSATIITPPNPELRWEKVGMLNLALDFSLIKNRLSGTIEFFSKHGIDLISDAPLAPSSGLPGFRGNTASLRTNGFDIRLQAKIIDAPFKWQVTVLLSHAKDKILQYHIEPIDNTSYVSGGAIAGNSQSALYSYRWRGLDPATGDPLGSFEGVTSNDYAAIKSSTQLQDIVYNGTRIPTYFGSVLNSFTWRNFECSFNIAYRFGYFFRRLSVATNLSSLSGSLGHRDYSMRWQKPGDESYTNVPSIIYPEDANRDYFYSNAEVLVERGDHIRLRDIQFSYSFEKTTIKKLPFLALRLYIYVNNFGVLWRANKRGIDPEAEMFGHVPVSHSIGCRISF